MTQYRPSVDLRMSSPYVLRQGFCNPWRRCGDTHQQNVCDRSPSDSTRRIALYVRPDRAQRGPTRVWRKPDGQTDPPGTRNGCSDEGATVEQTGPQATAPGASPADVPVDLEFTAPSPDHLEPAAGIAAATPARPRVGRPTTPRGTPATTRIAEMVDHIKSGRGGAPGHRAGLLHRQAATRAASSGRPR